MTELGMLIKRKREELDITLETIANEIGVGRSVVLKYQKGSVVTIGADKVLRLARVLQVDPIDILKISERQTLKRKAKGAMVHETEAI